MAPTLPPDHDAGKPDCQGRNEPELDLGALPAAVGARLRELRLRSGRSLLDLAAEAGVSVSTLSRLETGHRRPTLELLLPLARIHGVTLDELVGLPAPRGALGRSRPFRRDGVVFVPLSQRADGRRAFATVHPGTTAERPIRRRAHPGRTWLYVVRGELRLALGDREHVLRAGEATEIDTSVPHGLASATAEPVEVLNLQSRSGRPVRPRPLDA